MQRDLLIPTSGSTKRLEPLLTSITQQTTVPHRIVFLVHTEGEFENIESRIYEAFNPLRPSVDVVVIHHENSDYVPGNGVGYDRNYLVHQATSEYLYMIDDDNVFGETFFEDCVQEITKLSSLMRSNNFLWSPQIEYRNTGNIQSAGITGFRRWMPAMQYAIPGSKQKIQMIGANSLFGPTALFQKIGFDQQYRSCLEDIDFSYRVCLSGSKIMVSDMLRIQHMEREKSILEKKFLGSPERAYERSKNRILFAKKNATTWQHIQYFGLGLRAQTFWFLLVSLIWGGPKRWILRGSIVRGTWDGLRSFN